MLLTAALAYARHGIPVLPVHTPDPRGGCSCDRGVRCDRPGKHPRLRHGLTEATTDPRLIDVWWSRWPEANVGLRTGTAMDVADIDSAEGWHGLTHLLGGELPPGPRVRTGSGGWHLWFHPMGFGNRVGLLPGLDWRGVGGYVVAPPSRHMRGDYRWVRRPGDDLPVGPAILRDLVEGPTMHDLVEGLTVRDLIEGPAVRDQVNGQAVGSDALGDLAVGSDALGDLAVGSGALRGLPVGPAALRELIEGPVAAAGPRVRRAIRYPDRYGRAALAAESDRVASAPVGTRNDTLNRAAFALGRLVGAGLLDAGEVVRELDAAARQAGLGRAEVRRTIRSGLTAGRRSPIDPEAGRRVA
ncbi:bifunctional DNA primase/polymerase [Actinoplanes sp. CA-142083]|uniref:bifunctional DNA primase/polymerase n=1 Tax=Actinoplanes sp. CA-142083 TaxID=3239903 RepID=UPI003D8B65ED